MVEKLINKKQSIMYKYIKRTLLPFVVVIALLTSCDGMYDSLNDYAGEIIYPAKFDTVVGYIGYNRVEIDLLKAGRIPSSQISMGKAKKTVVEYDSTKLVIDSLASWLNIGNLTTSKLYRFYIYTIDEFENKSVPQEIALIPFTDSDKDALVVNTPRISYSPTMTSATLEWTSLSNVLFDFASLSYKYVDKDKVERKGEVVNGSPLKVSIENLALETTVNVDIVYNIIPKVDGKKIIDTLRLERSVTLVMSGDTPFSVDEESILRANGATTFTLNAVKNITKLVYPIQTNSFQDLIYFSSLKELDLTGGTLFNLTTHTNTGNGATSTVGGGKWLPFIRKVSPVSSANMQALKDKLEAGKIEKITYIPNSMGLDELLNPYVSKGIVKLVTLPEKTLVPNNFMTDGLVQTTNFRATKVYKPTDAPAGAGTEVYKFTLDAKDGSFVVTLPKEYRFNTEEYKYLELDVWGQPKSALQTGGKSQDYKRFWFRFMNYMWNFSSESSFGQEHWDTGKDKYFVTDNALESSWTTFKVDLRNSNSKHTRVIVINIGGEPGDGKLDSNNKVTYYISDLRFSKN